MQLLVEVSTPHELAVSNPPSCFVLHEVPLIQQQTRFRRRRVSTRCIAAVTVRHLSRSHPGKLYGLN